MLQKSNNQLKIKVLFLVVFISLSVSAQVSDSLLFHKYNYFSAGYLRSYYAVDEILFLDNIPIANAMAIDSLRRNSKLNGCMIAFGRILKLKDKVGMKISLGYNYRNYFVEHLKPVNPDLIKSITTWHFVSPGLSVLYQYHGLAFEAGFRANVVAKNRRVRIFKEDESIETNRASFSFFQYEFATHIPLIRKENNRTFLSLSVICDADILKDRTGYSVLYAASIKTEMPKLRRRKK